MELSGGATLSTSGSQVSQTCPDAWSRDTANILENKNDELDQEWRTCGCPDVAGLSMGAAKRLVSMLW